MSYHKHNTPSIKAILSAFPRLNVDQANELKAAMQDNKGLACANRLLDGCGIESIGLPEGCFYVNLGDTYDTTLLKVNGRYRIGSWGDVVEQYDRC